MKPGTKKLLSDWLDRFDSPATVDGYRRDVAQFATWLGDRDVLTAKRPDVQGWIRHLQHRGLADPTIRRKASAVSSFLTYAMQEGRLKHNPAMAVKRPRGDNAQRLGLNDEAATRLAQAAVNHSPKAGALVTILLTSGLRISEALNLDIGDITTDAGTLIAKARRKGGKTRRVPIAADVHRRIDRLIADRTEGPIFTGAHRGRYSRQDGYALIRELGETAGVGHVTPHTLRHTVATSLIRAGVPIEKVCELLDHRSIETTRRYAAALAHLQADLPEIAATHFLTTLTDPA